MSGQNGNGADKEITIEELLARIDGATGGMSATHPNRILLEQCKVAIVYLANKIPDEQLRYRSPIIMP